MRLMKKTKKNSLTIFLLFVAIAVFGQNARVIMPREGEKTPSNEKQGLARFDSEKPKAMPIDTVPRIHVWRINETTGDTIVAIRDSVRYNFQQTTLADGQSVAIGHLGNVGSPYYSKLFFENEYERPFFYWNALESYINTPGKQLFYNTKIPYSNLYYQSGGGQYNKEERLKGIITSNFGKYFNAGFNIDYTYARGYYQYQSNKSLDYNLFASYSKDNYEMHAWGGNYYHIISENGGISNDLYITNPNAKEFASTSYSSGDLPVNMESAWNRVKGRQLFFTNRYHLGYYKEETKHVLDKDTIVSTFVPVASFIFTSQYTNQNRKFISEDSTYIDSNKTTFALDTLYSEKYYSRVASDLTSFTQWKNTFGIAMREGFRDWVKFGLTAYIQHDYRSYSLPDTVRNQYFKHVQNSVSAGGMLSKTSGKFFKYDLNAEFCLAGYNLGEFKLNGKIQTVVNIAGKEASLTATGYVKNLKANYLESNVQSKYFWWNKDMGDIRRVFVGGELNLPQTGTKFSISMENIQNYQYFNANRTIDQEGGSVQVVSARLDQQLNAGILHWDNQIVYQTSTNQDVIPLPELSVYSNLYLKTKIAKVLTLQAGVDAHYHTTYYAPGYEPALMAFYNQKNVKIGGFPLSTIYVNAHLKRTRFFIMYYNVTKSVGNYGYFTMPHYPANPAMLRWGLSWDFDD